MGNQLLSINVAKRPEMAPPALDGARHVADGVGSGDAEGSVARRRMARSGTMTTAGNLVFQSAPAANLIAVPCRQRRQAVDSVTLGASAGAGSITYEIGGVQYVATLPLSARRDCGRVVVYKLGGNVSAAAGSAGRAAAGAQPTGRTSAPKRTLAAGRRFLHQRPARSATKAPRQQHRRAGPELPPYPGQTAAFKLGGHRRHRGRWRHEVLQGRADQGGRREPCRRAYTRERGQRAERLAPRGLAWRSVARAPWWPGGALAAGRGATFAPARHQWRGAGLLVAGRWPAHHSLPRRHCTHQGLLAGTQFLSDPHLRGHAPAGPRSCRTSACCANAWQLRDDVAGRRWSQPQLSRRFHFLCLGASHARGVADLRAAGAMDRWPRAGASPRTGISTSVRPAAAMTGLLGQPDAAGVTHGLHLHPLVGGQRDTTRARAAAHRASSSRTRGWTATWARRCARSRLPRAQSRLGQPCRRLPVRCCCSKAGCAMRWCPTSRRANGSASASTTAGAERRGDGRVRRAHAESHGLHDADRVACHPGRQGGSVLQGPASGRRHPVLRIHLIRLPARKQRSRLVDWTILTPDVPRVRVCSASGWIEPWQQIRRGSAPQARGSALGGGAGAGQGDAGANLRCRPPALRLQASRRSAWYSAAASPLRSVSGSTLPRYRFARLHRSAAIRSGARRCGPEPAPAR